MIDLRNTKINCLTAQGTINKELVDMYCNACKAQGITNMYPPDKEAAYLFCCNAFDAAYAVEWMGINGLRYFNSSPERTITEEDLNGHTITLSNTQYQWLHAVMQNPLNDNEFTGDALVREQLFNLTK